VLESILSEFGRRSAPRPPAPARRTALLPNDTADTLDPSTFPLHIKSRSAVQTLE
jgi:hypothetical protein